MSHQLFFVLLRETGQDVTDHAEAEELGKHLGYSKPRKAVIKIYERFSGNFENKRDSAVVKLTMAQKAISGLPSNRKQTQNTRIFSERGALKII